MVVRMCFLERPRTDSISVSTLGSNCLIFLITILSLLGDGLLFLRLRPLRLRFCFLSVSVTSKLDVNGIIIITY